MFSSFFPFIFLIFIKILYDIKIFLLLIFILLKKRRNNFINKNIFITYDLLLVYYTIEYNN